MIQFEVDPCLVHAALNEGRKLIITVHGDKLQYRKATIGDYSPHATAIAIANRAARAA